MKKKDKMLSNLQHGNMVRRSEITLSIQVKNNCKRGIIVHNSSQKQDWIVPWGKNGRGGTKQEFDFPGGKDDYLVIAITPGAGDLKWCRAELPVALPFVFIPEGMEKISILTSSDGERTTLRIPPGPPIMIISNTLTVIPTATLMQSPRYRLKWNIFLNSNPDGKGSREI